MIAVIVGFAVFTLVGLSQLLSDTEERRNIYATQEDCGKDYGIAQCQLVAHNDLWYGPWYRIDSDEPDPGPATTDPDARKQYVVNVERRSLGPSISM